jgi:hypothetical protein
MNKKRSSYDYRPIIVLVSFILFAFVLLVELVAPGRLHLVSVLPALLVLVRLAIGAAGE